MEEYKKKLIKDFVWLRSKINFDFIFNKNQFTHGDIKRYYKKTKYLLYRLVGSNEEYCNICITHSYLNNDIICTAGEVPNPQDKPSIAEFVKTHKYTIEEKLINLCDLMCPQGGKSIYNR